MIPENKENDCSEAVPVEVIRGGTPAPDLVVESPRSNKRSVEPEGAFRIGATVRNQGDGRASETTLRYYRSPDRHIDMTDTFLRSASVGALSASATWPQSIGQRAPEAPGTYYYGACVDPVSGESDSANNCSEEGVRVTVSEDDVVSGFRLASGNDAARGIAYVNRRFYVADSADDKVYAYSSSSGARVTSADFELHSRNDAARRIAYASGRFYVVDFDDGRVYVYARGGTRSFRLSLSNSRPYGITYANGRLYVTDSGDEKVYAYTSSGERVRSAEFDLHSSNGNAAGMVYAGGRLFVVDSRDDRVYAYPVREGGSGADLVVESPRSTESSVEPGGTLRIGATVRNQGDERSAATTLRYYRSRDRDIDTTDTRAGTDRIGALSPSATDRQSVSQRAPSTPGTYYYGACVDSVSGETNTGNNCSSGVRVTVMDGGDPDLVVSDASVSDASPGPGEGFTLRATVRNQGGGRSASTTLHYYRSSSATIITSDTRVGTDAVGALSASGSSPESISLTAPSTPDTYYYGACVDSVSGESDTGNNCSTGVRVQVTTGPVTVRTFNLHSSNGHPDGIAWANGRFFVTDRNDDKVYAYDGSGRRVSSDDFSLTSSNGDPDAITYADGRFYVADYHDRKVYAYTSDGEHVSSAGFNVSGQPEGITHVNGRFYVLLRPARVSVYTTGGTHLSSASFSLASGNGNPQGITHAKGRLYVLDGTDDKVYAYTSGGSSVSSADFRLDSRNGNPEGITHANDHFRVVDFDDRKVYGYTGDGDDGDPSGPDLVVESPSVSDSSPSPGSRFTLRATVRNRGDERSASTTLRYYRSSDSTITTSDTQVGTDSVSALSASRSSPESISLTAPSTSRTYYYGACVDSVSGETNTGNNCSQGVRVTIGEQTGPDLVVESPSVSPSSPRAGSRFTLRATVRNRGGERSASTTLVYYRSSNSTIASSDTQVGTDSVSALASSRSGAESISLTAPSTAGTYYYGACVDSVSGETNTGNNCSRGVPVTVGGNGGAGSTFDLDPGNGSPTGIAFADGHFFVVNGARANSKVYAYSSSGSRVPSRDFDVPVSYGIGVADDKLYAVGQKRFTLGEKVYAFGTDGNRAEDADFDLHSDNYGPRGITYASGRFYVVDVFTDKVFVYNSNGDRVPSDDFDLSAIPNPNAYGISAASGRLYVVDKLREKVYAYSSGGGRVPSSDFDLDSNNEDPDGITYANGRFYVVDSDDDKVYAYSGSEGR